MPRAPNTPAWKEIEITEDMLARYDRPGPRYTSYPTAPVWTTEFGPAQLEAAYRQADNSSTPVSLYTHLPFCESLCLFCCCTVSIQKDRRVLTP